LVYPHLAQNRLTDKNFSTLVVDTLLTHTAPVKTHLDSINKRKFLHEGSGERTLPESPHVSLPLSTIILKNFPS
jgi:hypothetical protein